MIFTPPPCEKVDDSNSACEGVFVCLHSDWIDCGECGTLFGVVVELRKERRLIPSWNGGRREGLCVSMMEGMGKGKRKCIDRSVSDSGTELGERVSVLLSVPRC